ncbi:MAG: protein-glutamate O-methyltransferase CheR [Deltaproteobacteria bacterium]|nr:protein-glutamate O-methyltransferase CheR [Deltaproteobacteria bacterium]
MEITGDEFDLFRSYIHQKFGINLTDKKRSLLVSRLQKIIRESGFGSFQNYYEYLVKNNDHGQIQELINRISTNHTFFNREKDHFEFFSQVALPEVVNALKKKGKKDLRIWCAGCSTGEEAYMLLMLMDEFFGSDYPNWNAGILATDISQRVLDIALPGIYSEEKIQSLPTRLRNKYTSKLSDGNYQMIDRLRKEVTFRKFNLMNSVYPFKNPFHIIFCRNVMIYFDEIDRKKVVNHFYHLTEPNGYLFIGHSETLGRKQQAYTYIQPALYKKVI